MDWNNSIEFTNEKSQLEITVLPFGSILILQILGYWLISSLGALKLSTSVFRVLEVNLIKLTWFMNKVWLSFCKVM